MTAFLRPSLAVFAACTLSLAACSDSSSAQSPPAAPTDLAASPFNGAVALSWIASSGAATYNVYRSTSSGLQPAAMTLVASGIGETAYTAAAANELLQYYRVTAVNPVGESPGSIDVSATPLSTLMPATPRGVKASEGIETVTLTWDAVPGAIAYKVYWRGSPGVTTDDASFTCDSSPCAQTLLTGGEFYFYAVTALIPGSESAPSAEVSATPLALPYISATALMRPGVVNRYSVTVCARLTGYAGCTWPIRSATVTIGETALTFDGIDTFVAEPTGSIAGANVDLVVIIPTGWGVAGGTYSASGTMYTVAPTLTNPTNGTVWQASQDNELTWAPASPADGSIYSYTAFNLSHFDVAVFGTVQANATGITIPADSLAPGSCLGYVAISPAVPIAIPNTREGSGFQVKALSPAVSFTTQ